jgi:hypothetical protein
VKRAADLFLMLERMVTGVLITHGGQPDNHEQQASEYDNNDTGREHDPNGSPDGKRMSRP